MTQKLMQETDGGVVFWVKVVPSSSRTAVMGLLEEMVKIKVAAAAEKGKANQCLIEFLAKKLEIKKKDVSIISGKTSPVKQIKINRISSKQLTGKLRL